MGVNARKEIDLTPLGTGGILYFRYRNHRGEEADRRARPIRVWYGESPLYYGPHKQYFLEAWDMDKQSIRDFALLNIIVSQAGPVFTRID